MSSTKVQGKEFFSKVKSLGFPALWPKPHIQPREYPLVPCKGSLLLQECCGQSLLVLQRAGKQALPPLSSSRALLADIHGGFSALDHELQLKLLFPSLSGLAAADWKMQMETVSSSLAERVWHEAPHSELHLCCS